MNPEFDKDRRKYAKITGQLVTGGGDGRRVAERYSPVGVGKGVRVGGGQRIHTWIKRVMIDRPKPPKEPEGMYITADGYQRECGETVVGRKELRRRMSEMARLEVLKELFG